MLIELGPTIHARSRHERSKRKQSKLSVSIRNRLLSSKNFNEPKTFVKN